MNLTNVVVVVVLLVLAIFFGNLDTIKSWLLKIWQWFKKKPAPAANDLRADVMQALASIENVRDFARKYNQTTLLEAANTCGKAMYDVKIDAKIG